MQKQRTARAGGAPPETPDLRYTIVHEGDRVALRVFEAGRGVSKRQRVTPHCSILWRGTASHHTDVGLVLHDPFECIHHLWAHPAVRLVDLVKVVLLYDARVEDAAENLARIGIGFSRVFRWAKKYPAEIIPQFIVSRIGVREVTTP